MISSFFGQVHGPGLIHSKLNQSYSRLNLNSTAALGPTRVISCHLNHNPGGGHPRRLPPTPLDSTESPRGYLTFYILLTNQSKLTAAHRLSYPNCSTATDQSTTRRRPSST